MFVKKINPPIRYNQLLTPEFGCGLSSDITEIMFINLFIVKVVSLEIQKSC